jgi:hypothetical protein
MSEVQPLSGIDQLLTPSKRRYKTVTLPVSGMVVRIQSLTEREVSAFHASALASNGTSVRKSRLEEAARRFIMLCVVDSDGNRMLNESHLPRLADWDSADAGFLYNECAAHAGTKTSDIEDLIKNSETTNVGE